jgi:hypothetical protein
LAEDVDGHTDLILYLDNSPRLHPAYSSQSTNYNQILPKHFMRTTDYSFKERKPVVGMGSCRVFFGCFTIFTSSSVIYFLFRRIRLARPVILTILVSDVFSVQLPMRVFSPLVSLHLPVLSIRISPYESSSLHVPLLAFPYRKFIKQHPSRFSHIHPFTLAPS